MNLVLLGIVTLLRHEQKKHLTYRQFIGNMSKEY